MYLCQLGQNMPNMAIGWGYKIQVFLCLYDLDNDPGDLKNRDPLTKIRSTAPAYVWTCMVIKKNLEKQTFARRYIFRKNLCINVLGLGPV